MRLRASTFVFLVLCFECALLVNVLADSDNEITSSLLSRASGWDCSTDTECTIANTTCIDGYCECEGGYMYNTNWTACLLTATAYGDPCTETLQCSTYLMSGAICEDEICVCAAGYHYTRGRCYSSSGLGEACNTDMNCYVNADNEATSCVDGICVCSEGFYQREYRTCRRGGYAEGDECAIDLDCQFENGVCNSSYVCTTSSTNTTTVLESEVYQESSVAWSLGRADENATIGSGCTSDADCAALANSNCGAANTCVCNRASYASTDLSTCIREIGEECSSDDDVSITNSLCRNGTWSCGYSTVASVNQKICRKSTKYYNWSCLHDEQCYIFGPDSSCQSKRCLCNAGSHLVEDQSFCWVNRGMGESCQADEDCYVENLDVELTCTNSVCTCPNGTEPNADKTLCKNSAAALGDVCDEDVDCAAANSVCTDSVCVCPDNYYDVENYCQAGINAACSLDSDCVVENSACSELQVCECAEGFIVDGADVCLTVAAYGDECQSNVQCSASLSNTYCTTDDDESNSTTNSVCQCESNYHYRFGTCNMKAALGESCTSLAECYTETGIEEVVCRTGICACSYDSTEDGTGCSRVASDATTFFLSTWLGLFLLGVKVSLV